MKKNMIYLPFIIIFSFLSANTISLADNGDGSWNVNYSSEVAMGGFQFNVDDATINSASGGDAGAAGFMTSSSATTVLGFSLTGASIPAGSGTLVVLDLTGTPTGLSGIVVSDPSGAALDFEFTGIEESEDLDCEDDPNGINGFSCDQLLNVFGLSCDMLFSETLVSDVCPLSCGTCPDDSGGISDGCDLPDLNMYLATDGSVLYNSSDAIGGFQFNVDGATINSASDGDAGAAGFMISASGTTALGFSLTGATFGPGCGTMVVLDLTGDATGLSGIVISDPFGNAIAFEYYSDGGDPVPGCTDNIACNFDADATENDGSCEYAQENYDCYGNCIAQEDVCGVCGGNGSSCTATIDILYNTTTDIGGFQFNIDGVTVLGASSGAAGAAGFMISTSGTTVLGFSLTGATIPSGSGILVEVDVMGDENAACLANVILSDASGVAIDNEINDCLSIVESACDDLDADGICDDVDDCVGEYDICGVCNGNGYPDGACDCAGSVDLGCGCGAAGPSGCDNACGSTLEDDECGVCGGSGIADGACDCAGNVDAGCGCGAAGPSGCDNECGSTLENDECGVCGGSGIADGACDCAGNVDAGCGCGAAGPSGCDNACGSALENDECGVCGGSGIPDGDCDCSGSVDLGCGCGAAGPSGCDNACGSTAVDDECGVCGGDGPVDGYDCDGNELGGNPPNWEDDPGAYEFTATIAGGIVLSDGVPLAESGDLFAAFDEAGIVRGVAVQLLPPFGPYQGQIVYEMQMRSNAEADLLSFKYYDASEDVVLDIAETYEFIINDILGDVVNPVFYNIGSSVGDCMDDDAAVSPFDCATAATTFGCDFTWGGSTVGELCPVSCDLCDEGEDVEGCMDDLACNYNSDATMDDGSCDYQEENYDCDGNCTAGEDCNGDCAGTAELDECSICGGGGIPDGDCDCDGNVDLGCGCGQAGPSGCDNACGSTAELDECGVCGGGGQVEGYNCDGLPELFIYNTSMFQAFYFFGTVSINGNAIDADDWVGAFSGDVCVGAKQWDVSQCGDNEICEVVVGGNDGSEWTTGYMLTDEIPSFKIFDASENTYYDAVPSQDIPWQNFGFNQVDNLQNVIAGCTDTIACNWSENANIDDGSCLYAPDNYDCEGNCITELDCTGECAGSAELDECGVCGGSGIPEGDCDCAGNVDAGCGCGAAGPSGCDNECGSTLENDECGVCGGSGIPDGACDCAGNVDAGCGCGAAGPSGCDNACGSTLEDDECGVCGGSGIADGACDCAGNVDAGCGCGAAGPSGCDNECGSTLENDECGVCGGSGIADGACDCAGNVDAGCGCGAAGPSGCDNACGSTLENDECGVCGGSGIPDGDCDCSGSVDLGCGCGQAGPSGCDNVCGSMAELDECGVCGGGGIPDGNCDCDGNVEDCAGECGGGVVEDGCGVCGGDNSSCDAPELFSFEQSSQQAYYYFNTATINGELLTADDWVGAFSGDVCVGARNWNTSLCGNGVCDVPIMGVGSDYELYTYDYMEPGEIPSFKVFDASESAYYDAVASEDIQWGNLIQPVIENLNVEPDCNGDLGGTAWESDCGCVDADNSGDDCDDCAGVPYGTNWESDCGCVDAGNSGDDCDDCAGAPNGDALVDDCGDCVSPDDFNTGQDECGVCYGDNADMDCAAECFGDHWESDCGCVDADNSGDDCDDCAGVPNGISVVDDCDTCDADPSNDCVAYSIALDGVDLISFHALPEENAVTSLFSQIVEYNPGILGEGMSANYVNGMWLGTLMDIEPTDGYWVVMENNVDLDVVGIPTDHDTEYDLHINTNLVSYPFSGYAPIFQTIPNDAQIYIDAILGEGTAAMNTPNGWLGGLVNLSGTEGYWFITNAEVSFSYNPPEEGTARMVSPIRSVPLEYTFNQSTQQAFYFVKNATIDGEAIDTEDLIIAYNGDVIVGSRYWYGDVTDVPAMGADNSEAYAGYCTSGDKVSFKVWDASSRNLVDMIADGEIGWNNLGVSIISLSERIIPKEISFISAYPNPFNPTTMLNFSVPTEMDVQVIVYDMRGRMVSQLANGLYESGDHEVHWDASQQSSGIYFVKMVAGNQTNIQKLMLVK